MKPRIPARFAARALPMVLAAVLLVGGLPGGNVWADTAPQDELPNGLLGGDWNFLSVESQSPGNLPVVVPSAPVFGALVYEDFTNAEAKAWGLLEQTFKFREDISPYHGKKNFDELVRQFDQQSDFETTLYPPNQPPGPNQTTMADRIAQADTDLRQARNLYAFLAVYAPRDVMRTQPPYTTLCKDKDNFAPKANPNDPLDPTVGPPIRDRCNFEARLSETVREAANIRMIFGQQFMVAALGVGMSGTLYGGDKFVKEEIGKLRVAQGQFKEAEALLTEGFSLAVGNGCLVSDFYGQQEWSLLSRAADSQIDAQREIGVRFSYIGVPGPQDVPAAQAKSADELRDGYVQGYAKLVRMAALAQNNLSACGEGVQPGAQLASDMAASMLEARKASLDVTSGRNIFGLDTTWTPTVSYAALKAEAAARVSEAQLAEDTAKKDERAFDDSQVKLMDATNLLLTSLDMEVSNQLGCSRLSFKNDEEFFGCARDQQKYLTQCAEYAAYETVKPEHPLPGITTFEQCMNRKDSAGQLLIPPADARQALYDLRGERTNLRSLQTKAADILKRVQLSNDANATVTGWIAGRGAAQTAAEVADQFYTTMVDADSSPLSSGAIGALGLVNLTVKAAAGAVSTAADVEIENANQHKEVQNMLLDMSELLIDAEVARSAAEAKYVAFVGILGHMDDVIAQTQRQRAYLKILPGNDPSYRIIRDSSRLAAAAAIRRGAEIAYLAARRAEYEYAARLSASNFSISQIYRARSVADVTEYLAKLDGIVTTKLEGAASDVYELPPISVAQDVLGWTDAALMKAYPEITTHEAAAAKRLELFRAWVRQNTKEVQGEKRLSFNFGTTVLDGGLFANLYGPGYAKFWLHKLTSVGLLTMPDGTLRKVRGMGVNVLTEQAGLTNAKVTVTQGGIEHLKNMDGCTFDFKLVDSAYMLGYEWAATQKPDVKYATFSADVNGANASVDGNFRTSMFAGRPVSATNWQVELQSSVPGSTQTVDFQKLTDIHLLFSTLHASRSDESKPQPKDCARIDW